MESIYDRYIYCSSLLPAGGGQDAGGATLADPSQDPERVCGQLLDAERLRIFVASLPDPLREIGQAMLAGRTQAAIARDRGVSDAAISKRLRQIGRIADAGPHRTLRYSHLLD